MKWASTFDTDGSLPAAVEHSAAKIFRDLDKREPDLVLAFISSEHAPHYEALPELLSREFESAFIIGCCAEGVIGAGKEVEDRPALALTAAVLPDVRLVGRHLEAANLPPAYAERRSWEEALGVSAADDPAFIIIGDPYSFEEESFLLGMDRSFPNSPKVGGLASGSLQAGSTALYLGNRMHRSGVIVLALSGNIQLDALVAQGCRPIGEPMFVTAAHENLIREVDGRMPRDVLADAFERLGEDDRELFSQSLFLGMAMRQDRSEYRAGDFLVRSILGMDPQSGALWINGRVPERSVVQFHLRDAATSAQDLERTLHSYKSTSRGMETAGTLLFSCQGRGASLYGQPDHDSNAFRRLVADVPLGGLFCSGEIGPVLNTTYLHAYSSTFGIFRPRK